MNLMDNTVIAFVSDHGDMLFDHKMVAKRCFYENSTKIPFILSGKPINDYSGRIEDKLGCMADVMPTVLDICGIPIPDGLDGIPLLKENQRHDVVYGEFGENIRATRMVANERYKLIYYPCGNVFHMFDLQEDPQELKNIANSTSHKSIREELEQHLVQHLYGSDLEWLNDGKLVGLEAPAFKKKADYKFYNQRGYHWPPPTGGFKSK